MQDKHRATLLSDNMTHDLKTYGLIPVKSQSTRFPDKNFSEFCSPTNGLRSNLISNTINKLLKARIDKIFISTDTPEKVNEKIVSPPAAFDNLYILKRPKELATPETTQDEVIHDFISQLSIEKNYVIILCQVTSPNWYPHRLSYALNKLKQHRKTIVSVSPDYKPNGCFYIFTKEMFLQHQSIYNHDNGIYLVVIPWKESTDIDYPYQLPIAEAINKGNYDK